jgi:hypothetical protein
MSMNDQGERIKNPSKPRMHTDGDEAKYPCLSVFIRGLNLKAMSKFQCAHPVGGLASAVTAATDREKIRVAPAFSGC